VFVSCSRMELSALARAMTLPSGEKTADVVRAGAANDSSSLPVPASQRRNMRSNPQETTVLPSGESTIEVGARQWPSRAGVSLPVAASQRRAVLPAAEAIHLPSGETARARTSGPEESPPRSASPPV